MNALFKRLNYNTAEKKKTILQQIKQINIDRISKHKVRNLWKKKFKNYFDKINSRIQKYEFIANNGLLYYNENFTFFGQ